MAMANPIAKQLKNVRMLTLQDISLRRVAALLLNDPVKYLYDTIQEIKKCERKLVVSGDELFKSIVAELVLSDSMREQLVNIMDPIFQELYDWLFYHEDFFNWKDSRFCNQEYMKHLHWTSMGTVNYLKTAEAIIRDEKLSIDLRFRLSCLYCLEEDIRDLWEKLSPLTKESIFEDVEYGEQQQIVVFWAYILKGKEHMLDGVLYTFGSAYSSKYQSAFEHCGSLGCEAATKYFWGKLTCDEKDKLLVGTTVHALRTCRIHNVPSYNSVTCYLLSQMNANQLRTGFEYAPLNILGIFLNFPRQEALLEVVKLVSPFLDRGKYESLLLEVSRNFKKYNSAKVFRDLFLITPKDFRHSIVYLPQLFESENAEVIKCVLRNIDPAQTSEFVFSTSTLFSCSELVKKGKWDFLEFFIRESRLSKEDIEKFVVKIKSQVAPFVREMELHVRFTKIVNNISVGTSNQDFSKCNKVNQMVPIDFQASGQLDEELIERPAKKSKKI